LVKAAEIVIWYITRSCFYPPVFARLSTLALGLAALWQDERRASQDERRASQDERRASQDERRASQDERVRFLLLSHR